VPPSNGRYTSELSVIRSSTLEGDDAIWAHGDRHAATKDRAILARADFLAGAVEATVDRDSRLRIEPDVPPPLHALILGWPPSSEKERRKTLAKMLRANADPTLVIRPVIGKDSSARLD
jgi:hypothetical protein